VASLAERAPARPRRGKAAASGQLTVRKLVIAHVWVAIGAFAIACILGGWPMWARKPLDAPAHTAANYFRSVTLHGVSMAFVLTRIKTGSDPTRRQALAETIYEVAQVQIAEQGLPTRAIGRWFPYCATLLVFIWSVNMLGFIPLPLSDEKWHGVPTLSIFAATSTLSVTITLALMTWVFTHIEGIRENGAVKYFKSWIPDVPKALYPLIVPLEILGQFMRLISLSVRLYANMLAGHMLILS